MNKFSLKNVVILAALASLVGCASVAGTAAKQVELSKNGRYDEFAYGMVGFSGIDEMRKAACLNLKDERCFDKNYIVAGLSVSFGFADGGRGLWAFIPKSKIEEMELKKAMYESGYNCKTSTTSTNCYFGKFKIVPGQLAEFVEVVQRPGEKGPCHWSGLPRAGGTVCESLGFDYRTAKLPTVRNF